MRWHLIVELDGRPGAENMWADYAILRAARNGDGFLRLYRWNPPCLSFGRNESARRRYDIAAIRSLGIDTVRRPTGGRAVWHNRELTYAVAAPNATFGSLSATYRSIHTALASALERLGASVALADTARVPFSLSGGSCFASPVGGEIVWGGRKLVGSAQLREASAFLQHGSILLENDQGLVAHVSIGPSQPSATSLGEILGRSVPVETVSAAVAETARSSWEGEWVVDPGLPPSTPNRDETIDFRDNAWTWRR